MVDLTYLFEAHFSDGTMIQQTPEDVSKTDPDRSAYYDVVQRKNDVVAFGLFSNDSKSTYAVDLRDGHFEINGTPIRAQGAFQLGDEPKFELVFFRRHTHQMVLGQSFPPQDTSHSIEYFIGWKTQIKNDKGEDEEVTQTISVS